MIPGWLKGLVFAALLLLVAIDLGSPLVVRVQLDATAAAASVAGGRAWLRGGGTQAAEAAALAETEADGATLDHFEVLPDGRFRVEVAKRAESRALHRVEQLETWYDVRVEATSSGSTL